MAEKILGPQGSTRRRRFLWVPMLGALLATLYFITSAGAVHNTGIFQLDGNADTSVVTGFPAGAEDWSNVCAKFQVSGSAVGSDICHPASGVTLPSATTADRSTFITDVFGAAPGDNIFKGGTDDGSITPPDNAGTVVWQWKQATASPDKADIEQAFAAQYTCDTGAQSPICTNPAYNNHTIIYFGGTRQANNGDTNIAFWFLHNKVTVQGDGSVTDPNTGDITCPLTSGCNFTGTHTAGDCSLAVHPTPCHPGDLFVQSAFTSKPTISIYEWVGYHNADTCITSNCDLQQVSFAVNPTTNDNRCEQSSVTNEKGCAITNTGEIASPWVFKDKSTKSAANMIEDQELFEGGLDLTALGFGDECISTFMLNTRSSGSSVNSTDQDFALGQMGSCETHLSTTAGFASGTTIGTGTVSSGTDSATLSVDGVSTWSGTLDFYLCGPMASGTCSDDGAGKGVHVSSKMVSNSTSQPISSAVDANNNGTVTLSSVGRYCWFSRFTPDQGTADKGVGGQTDDGSANNPNKECFNVGKASPSLDTQAVIPNPDAPPPAYVAVPAGFKTAFGQAVYDQATLSSAATEPGSGGGKGALDSVATSWTTINPTTAGTIGGTISFTLKGYDGLNNKTPNCDDNASPYTGESQSFPIDVTVNAGNTTYPRANGAASAVSFKPDSPGTYHWIATYANASSVNNNVPTSHNTSCNDTKEDVTVQQIATSVKSRQSWFPNDEATVAAASGNLAAGGTVVFTLYNDGSCGGSGTSKYTETYTLAGGSSTEVASTHNYTGGKDSGDNAVTPFAITTLYTQNSSTTAGPYSWKVVYTPSANDAAHTGSSSSCTSATRTEKFSITYQNDNG